MGEESSVGDVKRTTRQPVVEPERGRGTVVDIHIGDRSVSIKFMYLVLRTKSDIYHMCAQKFNSHI